MDSSTVESFVDKGEKDGQGIVVTLPLEAMRRKPATYMDYAARMLITCIYYSLSMHLPYLKHSSIYNLRKPEESN